MTSGNKLKETDTKNRTFHYFDSIININDLNIDLLIHEKSNKNILIYVT